jgi:predicted XRE-type DNA-binding protein
LKDEHWFARVATRVKANGHNQAIRKNGTRMNELQVHNRSGNIFKDMGMLDAEERLAKAELARTIRKAIRERGLTHAEAAEILGAAQADVSDLIRGRLARFSMERLER